MQNLIRFFNERQEVAFSTWLICLGLTPSISARSSCVTFLERRTSASLAPNDVGSTHYHTYTKTGGDSDASDGDDEEWNLGEFSEDWYKSTPNFADANGNTLEIIYLDDGELDFSINGETMYYGMASGYTDYGDGIYTYTLKDNDGNEVSMLYYPTNTVQIGSMVFTVEQ